MATLTSWQPRQMPRNGLPSDAAAWNRLNSTASRSGWTSSTRGWGTPWKDSVAMSPPPEKRMPSRREYRVSQPPFASEGGMTIGTPPAIAMASAYAWLSCTMGCPYELLITLDVMPMIGAMSADYKRSGLS